MVTSKSRTAVALALALCGMVWSLAWGVAEVTSMPAVNAMYQWEEEGTLKDQSDWQTALDFIQTAHLLNPISAEYEFYTGKLHEWKALAYPVWSADSRRHRTLAIEGYRQAIVKRPTWSVAWASLAQSKFYKQELDAETFNAIEKALIFDSWDQITRLKMIWIGLSIWEHLPHSKRKALAKAIERSVKSYHLYGHVIAMARQLDRAEVLLSVIQDASLRENIERELSK